MSEPSLNAQPLPEAEQSAQASSPILVSRVKNAIDTKTEHCDARGIIEQIRTDPRLRQEITEIREEYWRVMVATTNDRRAAKKAVGNRKKRLPGVMWLGTFAHRKQDALIQHAGFICVDLDDLGRDKVAEVRAKLQRSLYLWAIFMSPSGDGLKVIFRVPADAKKHKASFRAVEKHVRELTGLQIDKACSDVARLCFLSHDPDAYLNENAVELPLLVETATPARAETDADCGPEIQMRHDIAEELLPQTKWESQTRGYCICPGQHLHTTGDGERDCRVDLDGTPTIFCFHNSCRDIIKDLNGKLRSRINNLSESIPNDYPRNDTERAIRFVQLRGDDLRYVAASKQWFVWDGTRWLPDSDGAVFRKAQELPKLLLQEAAAIDDLDRRKRAVGAAIAAGDERKIKAMLSVAEYQTGIAASPALFDSNPYLVGVTNGVVDLRTGTFRPAKREDYITKQLGAAFDPNATCPTWERFLARVLNGDPDLISFIQRAVGYSLTGEVSEQCLFFLYGTGENGKSTFAEFLQLLFGDYALKATTGLYTLHSHGKEPESEIARLVGKRFVTGSETEEGAKLAESRVKDLTGGDTLTGRNLYCPAFNFNPTHKLWIYGNHLPDVRGSDHGIWRRIKLVPFQVQISKEEKDVDLPRKLTSEKSGILYWAIKGCLLWKETGLLAPPVVVNATAEYREDEDELGEFISETCIPEGRVERTHLYLAYKDWARRHERKYPLGPKAFAKRLRSRDGIRDSKSGERYWTGISLRPPPPEEAQSEKEAKLMDQFFPPPRCAATLGT
jgi:P4 family phage/plasmid primase-like protien